MRLEEFEVCFSKEEHTAAKEHQANFAKVTRPRSRNESLQSFQE
jgi:hypothetical protein